MKKKVLMKPEIILLDRNNAFGLLIIIYTKKRGEVAKKHISIFIVVLNNQGSKKKFFVQKPNFIKIIMTSNLWHLHIHTKWRQTQLKDKN